MNKLLLTLSREATHTVLPLQVVLPGGSRLDPIQWHSNQRTQAVSLPACMVPAALLAC
jgi:hypothetical protein